MYLVCKHKPDLVFEVLSYDKTTHSAELRNKNGVVTDPHFYPEQLKSDYILTQECPPQLRRE